MEDEAGEPEVAQSEAMEAEAAAVEAAVMLGQWLSHQSLQSLRARPQRLQQLLCLLRPRHLVRLESSILPAQRRSR